MTLSTCLEAIACRPIRAITRVLQNYLVTRAPLHPLVAVGYWQTVCLYPHDRAGAFYAFVIQRFESSKDE